MSNQSDINSISTTRSGVHNEETFKIKMAWSWRQICFIVLALYCIVDMQTIMPLGLQFMLSILVFIPDVGFLVSIGIVTYWCMISAQH